MKAIVNGKIVVNDKIINNGYILYSTKIIELGSGYPKLTYVDVIDAKGMYVIPGLIDIHTHGNCGVDTMDGSLTSLSTMANFLATNGVTCFLPTTMTSSIPKIHKCLTTIRSGMQRKFKSRIVGAHLEGPFISVHKKGAQLADNIINPSYEIIKDFCDVIKVITYAPENDTDSKFIKLIREEKNNIVLSAGHTNASYEDGIRAIKNGLSSSTHLFNGMTALHHRNPGIIAAILESDIYCELIADNIHIHPVWYRLLLKVKGVDKIVLISDSMKATGLKDGEYEFGGQQVIVKESVARLKNIGSLAGSTLTLNKAAYNFMLHSEESIVNIVKMVTINPARLLGIEHSYGSLEPGKVADIVVCDGKFNIMNTILAGTEVF